MLSNGQINGWLDRSGNNRNAVVSMGTPEYNQTAGPSNLPVIQLRCGEQGEFGDEEFSITGSFSLKDHFFLVRSPTSNWSCLLYTSPSPRDATLSRMPSSA